MIFFHQTSRVKNILINNPMVCARNVTHTGSSRKLSASNKRNVIDAQLKSVMEINEILEFILAIIQLFPQSV